MPWQAQVQKLRRIANRAQKHADHMDDLLDTFYFDMLRDAETPAEIAKATADMNAAAEDRNAARAKARGAAEEMVAVAKANNDPRAAGL